MAEENKKETTQSTDTKKNFKKNSTKIRPKRKKDFSKKGKRDKDPIDFKLIDIRRVMRVYKGGRRLRFSVFVVVGDRKGKVGLGLGKGLDIRTAQEKAINKAKRNMVRISLNGNTIPHDIEMKYGAAKVLLKPAAPGTGIVAGSSMRMVAEVAGIKDVLGKILGTNNKIANAYASIEALKTLRSTRL
ncbi:MAG: hypothetical protein Kow0081_2690 [Candidatus Dojkabacteria bacterium]